MMATKRLKHLILTLVIGGAAVIAPSLLTAPTAYAVDSGVKDSGTTKDKTTTTNGTRGVDTSGSTRDVDTSGSTRSTSSAGTSSGPAAGTPSSEACEALGSGTNCEGGKLGGGLTIERIITFVITILSFIVGVAAVIMIIVGGFKYVTANGDSSKISSAKTTLIYALVGLFIVGIAQALVATVLNQTLGF